MTYRKKLIEVSLPLEAINREAAREKSIRHGHPSTLHLWWARRPLAACRAVLFAALVDDPAEYLPDEEAANRERERLFALLAELVKWENSTNEEILDKARLEIARSVARALGVEVPVGKQAIREFLATQAPPLLDPFAGGGSIPLEAQRLGLRAYASDLNPVAVLINKALIEIPPKFADLPPVHPPDPATALKGERSGAKGMSHQGELWQKEWKGAAGLAEDVRYYGQWMRAEAERRIGHLYPKAKITGELLAERPDLRQQGLKPGDELTVIAWLWARTVPCPNPACGARMPLATSFVLSSKRGKEAWIVPLVDQAKRKVDFTVCVGKGSPPPSPKVGRGAQFRCLVCGQIAPEDAIRAEFKAKHNSAQLMAIVAEGRNGRVYLPPDAEQVHIAQRATPPWIPEEEMNTETPNLVSGRGYGITHWHELFTARQLTALTTFSDLVKEAHARVLADARRAFHSPHPAPFPPAQGKADSPRPAEEEAGRRPEPVEGVKTDFPRPVGEEAGVRDLPQAYADAVATYLAFAVDKGANYWSSFCAWHTSRDIVVSTFARQALPMIWDYAEANPFSNSSGNFLLGVEQASEMLEKVPAIGEAIAKQANAMESAFDVGMIISTDPPYYDNIGYADLSDFFYIWLRHSLKTFYPSLFVTMTVPKSAELVATPYRFDGDRRKAEEFFETGLRQTFKNLQSIGHPTYPTTVFYAFKQSESEDELGADDLLFDTRASTGWETMLAGLIEAGFQITGTLPMRTELITSLKKGINALASSIVLVCRPRPADAPAITRREFLAALKRELPAALRQLQQGNIAPVDLAQAAIGPGMAIFSRHRAVLEADGSPMRVRTALALINQALDEYLTEQEGEYDSDTRWALAWFEQYGHEEGPYGVAETLSKAKNTSVEGLVEAGILLARGGKVRLLRRAELGADSPPSPTLPSQGGVGSPRPQGAGRGRRPEPVEGVRVLWDPRQDKRPTAWEAVQHLIQALDTHGEQGAAWLLSRLGSLGETARDLAYRLYTLCERKGWAQDALAYNMLVVAWPKIKEQADKVAQQGRMSL